jgi:hypothetical protein
MFAPIMCPPPHQLLPGPGKILRLAWQENDAAEWNAIKSKALGLKAIYIQILYKCMSLGISSVMIFINLSNKKKN